MWQYVLYALSFFLITLFIQSMTHKLLVKKGNRNVGFWIGYQVVICLCIVGLITGKLYYLASIIGFVIADEIGKKKGWH